MTIKKSILTVLVLHLVCFIASSQDFPEPMKPVRLVNDFASILTPTQQQTLEQMLVSFDDTTSTQLSVVTVQSVGEYDIAQYASQLAERWGIGNKGRDNGILLLVAVKDRRVNISTGYGVEGALPDAIAKRIIQTDIVPAFKANNYYGGIARACQSIMEYTAGEYEALPGNRQAQQETFTETGRSMVVPFIILMILLMFINRNRNNHNRRDGWKNGRGGGRRRGGSLLPWILLGGLSGGRGGGFGDFRGGSGPFGGGGGGGFGGFGGGSFGGGGASGSW